MKSRIDFFLIAKLFTVKTKSADIHVKTAISPDHKTIRFSLQNECKKQGPGLWKVNNSLFDEECFVDLQYYRKLPDYMQKICIFEHLKEP